MGEPTLTIVVNVVIVLIGIISIVGARKRWAMYVSPPKGSFRRMGSNYRFEQKFGPKATIIYTYFIGIAFIAYGLYRLWEVFEGGQ